MGCLEEAAATMSSADDAALLSEIALRCSEQAFTTLFERYEQKAYNLSLYICLNSTLAEEAVQEAFLRVWSFAGSFRPDGKAHAWLMHIVAHESLRVVQRQKSRRAQESRRAQTVSQDYAVPAATLEEGECATALRRILTELPKLEQQLVALHFGAGISQEEVGRALKLSQRMVSYKLKGIMDLLRTRLTQMGFATALPLLSAEGLNKIICSGYPAPPSLHGKVVSQVAARHLNASARHLGRSAVAKSGLALIVSATVAVVASAVGAWALLQKSAPAVPSPAPAIPAPVTPAAIAPWCRYWDFNKPDAARDFIVTTGAWHHSPDSSGEPGGCMETDTETFCATIDIPIGKPPFLVTFDAKPLLPMPRNHFYYGVEWTDYRQLILFGNVGPLVTLEHRIQWYPAKDYVCENYIDYNNHNRRTALIALVPVPGARLQLAARGRCRFDNITIKEISRSELPDVSAYLAALERIDPAKRTGTIVLPEFKSARPPAPVTVTFEGERQSRN